MLWPPGPDPDPDPDPDLDPDPDPDVVIAYTQTRGSKTVLHPSVASPRRWLLLPADPGIAFGSLRLGIYSVVLLSLPRPHLLVVLLSLLLC